MNGMFVTSTYLARFEFSFSPSHPLFLEEEALFLRQKEPEFPSYFAPVLPFKQSLGHSPTEGGRPAVGGDLIH